MAVSSQFPKRTPTPQFNPYGQPKDLSEQRFAWYILSIYFCFMPKKLIDISDKDLEDLKKYSKEEKRSPKALVEKLIQDYLIKKRAKETEKI